VRFELGGNMGYATGSHIGLAGKYLLGILKEEGQIRYSRFYDGSDEAADALMKNCGYESEMDAPECMMDVAVAQLEHAGIVATRSLPEKLADGEQDYEIRLTDEGEQFLAGGQEFQFRDVDL